MKIVSYSFQDRLVLEKGHYKVLSDSLLFSYGVRSSVIATDWSLLDLHKRTTLPKIKSYAAISDDPLADTYRFDHFKDLFRKVLEAQSKKEKETRHGNIYHRNGPNAGTIVFEPQVINIESLMIVEGTRAFEKFILDMLDAESKKPKLILVESPFETRVRRTHARLTEEGVNRTYEKQEERMTFYEGWWNWYIKLQRDPDFIASSLDSKFEIKRYYRERRRL